MTPKDIFAEMPKQLDANAAKGMNSTIQFNLSGDNGGQWYVNIKDVGSSRVDLQACKLEYSIVSPK